MKRYYFIGIFVLSMFFTCCQSQTGENSIVLTPKVFQDSLVGKTIHLVDVRTLKEFHTGHINDALNIDYNSENFKDSLKELDRNKSVFIYCRSGKRSSKSAAVFKALGFKNVYELEGGIIKWQQANFEVSKQ